MGLVSTGSPGLPRGPRTWAWLAALLVGLLAPAAAHAQTYTWNQATSGGMWQTASNWSPNGPPNAAANVILHEDRLDVPLSWRQPRMVFVNSMSDLFHELVPGDFVDQVFATMSDARRHVFQIL